MADSKPPAAAENSASALTPDMNKHVKQAKPLKPPNPMWKYLGFGENFRPRVPSRNWLIFLSITGSFTAAIIYDKREKKRAQRKWCRLVEHLAKEPLEPRSMARKLTVFLEAPPTDGLRVAQDHFKEYVKPILVASGLDWEFIQGRKEGDVRAEIAENIRNLRLPSDQRTEDDPVLGVRRNNGVTEFEGPRGDIVIGRHTWKEYIRGIHEGWLGPLTEPPKPEQAPEAGPDGSEATIDVSVSLGTSPNATQTSAEKADIVMETMPGISIDSIPREADAPSETKPDTSSEKPSKPPQPPPFITTSEYSSAILPPNFPAEFDPSTPISFPHILGFLNTPTRLWRFLNRRYLADSIGRETAAIILANCRPYNTDATTSNSMDFAAEDQSQSPQGSADDASSRFSEQQQALIKEEAEWHKKVRVRTEGEPERTWLDPVFLDPRIASRMRRSQLTAEDEERAKKIVVPEEEIEGWIKGSFRSMGRSALAFFKGQPKKKSEEGESEMS